MTSRIEVYIAEHNLDNGQRYRERRDKGSSTDLIVGMPPTYACSWHPSMGAAAVAL